MYFFSNTYIQINNNTKTKIKIRIENILLALGLLFCFHLAIKPALLDVSKLESTSWSLENLD